MRFIWTLPFINSCAAESCGINVQLDFPFRNNIAIRPRHLPQNAEHRTGVPAKTIDGSQNSVQRSATGGMYLAEQCTAFCDWRNVLAVHWPATSGVPSRYKKICTAFCDRRNVLAVHCTATSGVPSRYEKICTVFCERRNVLAVHCTAFCNRRNVLTVHCTTTNGVPSRYGKICTAFCDRINVLAVHCTATSAVPSRYEKICTVFCERRNVLAVHCTATNDVSSRYGQICTTAGLFSFISKRVQNKKSPAKCFMGRMRPGWVAKISNWV